MRYVVIPQAVRRVIPPLLNDFIGLQKDTVLVSFIGVVEIFRPVPDPAGGLVQLHAVPRDRARVPRRSRSRWPASPTGSSRATGRRARRAARHDRRRRDGRPTGVARCGSRACTSRSAISRCCAGSTSRSTSTRSSASSARRGAASRRCCAASTCSSRSTPAGSSSRATRSPAPGVDVDRDPAADRDRVPGVQPVPAHDACWTT